MTHILRIRIGLLACLLVTASPLWALVDIPLSLSRVTDLTGTLSSTEVNGLQRKLSNFEDRKGSQIVVLMLPSTQPETIEQYSIRLAEQWQIGREGIDDGVIMLVAKDDHQLRIEVGYGLEDAIPDAIAKRVITEIITPHFKADDFAGGIDAGVDQLIRLIDGENLPPPTKLNIKQFGQTAFMVIFGLGLVAGVVLSLIFGRLLGGLLAGIGTAVVGLFFGLGLVAFLLAFFVFLMIGIKRNHDGNWPPTGGGFGNHRRRHYSNRSYGNSWGGGGGGKFGGGGASGSW
ncbi:hypothetical protein JCM14076_00700 [Methylosoma difficile]